MHRRRCAESPRTGRKPHLLWHHDGFGIIDETMNLRVLQSIMPKGSGNFDLQPVGKVRVGSVRKEYSGTPLEVVHSCQSRTGRTVSKFGLSDRS